MTYLPVNMVLVYKYSEVFMYICTCRQYIKADNIDNHSANMYNIVNTPIHKYITDVHNNYLITQVNATALQL